MCFIADMFVCVCSFAGGWWSKWQIVDSRSPPEEEEEELVPLSQVTPTEDKRSGNEASTTEGGVLSADNMSRV